jgi:hypothetical protein
VAEPVFHNTNVDYTFCDLTDRPLFSIEYDGIGGGLSAGKEYRAKRATADPMRGQKMTLKLQAAALVEYPLLVVSVDELQALDGDEEFTILDGIVGNLLQHLAFPDLATAMLAEQQEVLDELPSWESDELARDVLLQAEVLAELEHDPLARRASQFKFRALELGASTYRLEWMIDPDPRAVATEWPPAMEQVQAGLEAADRAQRIGCRVVVDLPGNAVPRIIRTAWMRNIHAPGLVPETIVENMATYFAFKQALELQGRVVG